MDIILRILVFLLGAAIAIRTVASAIVTFVLPRSAADGVSLFVFRMMRRIFDLPLRKARSYEQRDRIMALYAPIGLLMLPPAWLTLAITGYALMYWSLGAVESLGQAFRVSGSSIFTLGYATLSDWGSTLLMFTEVAIGLIFIALLISYLPTMYGAFQRRESAVSMLEVRAGSPPSALETILRYHRIHGLQKLTDMWITWEIWFADIEESHTTLAALVFFRSPQPDHSWVTAAGAILDAAAIAASTLDVPRDPQAQLCIRAGFIALRRIADFFNVAYNKDTRPDDPISVSRYEYDAVYDQLTEKGVPLKADRDQAWRDYAGWRVNYDTVLLALAAITLAPYAPWSSDRSLLPTRRKSLLRKAKRAT